MTNSLLLNNLMAYSLQIALLAAIAAVIPLALGFKVPRAKLLYWQLVLLACLLLPVIRPWAQVVAGGSLTVVTAITTVSHAPAHSAPIPWGQILLLLLGTGVSARLCLILLGFWRLRRYALHSRPLEPWSSWSAEATLLVSDEISSPVTFGVRKPVILLSANFSSLDESVKEAILWHEIVHVRRHDWLFTVAEEFVRALFWFHPAIWWLLSEIQLAREQAVDREVVEMTNAREEYVDALLAIAGSPPRVDLSPAPLFLKKRHLKQRVVSILEEVRVSKTKTISTVAAGLTVLAASCWFVTGVFPLEAAPQAVTDATGVAVDMNGELLVHRAPVNYPAEARAKGIQGTVVVQVKIDAAGLVSDAMVVSGPDELRNNALQSVLNWHFMKEAALSTRQVSIYYALPKGGQTIEAALRSGTNVPQLAPPPPPPPPPPVGFRPVERTVKGITVTGLSDRSRAELLSQLPVHEGDAFTADLLPKLSAAVRAFDSHLRLSIMPTDTSAVMIGISAPASQGEFVQAFTPAPGTPQPIRVGSNVVKANLLSQTPAAYPALAKAARVQGTVTLEATIGKDGHVANLQLSSGPPLLVQAATEAVQKWVYKPTLLNGNPVEVLTTVDVNFTLTAE